MTPRGDARDAPGRLLVGEIGKPHGIAGEVYVIEISDDARRFQPSSRLFHEDGRTLIVEAARRHRDRLLVRFEEASSRTEAEGLRGALYVDAADVRELEQDEYWSHDLSGCGVVDPDGRPLGEVLQVVPGGAHDLLEIQTARGERLIPLVREIVVAVELESRRVVVDPPEGLLD